MLLAVAIGDSYGSSFEFASRKFVEEYNTADKYVSSPKYFKNQRLGRYTDDCQQSLAIAELLLDDVEWTHLNIADKLVEVYDRDPRGGYGKGSYMALSQATNGEEFISLINGNSTKSGGAMRSMALGFLNNIDEVIEKTTIQSCLTHNSDDGIASSLISALMTHYCRYNLGPVQQLPEWLLNYVDGPWRQPFNKEIVSTNGVECVHASLTMIVKYNNLKDILKGCINCMGDTDTVSAISLSAASEAIEIKNNIPHSLVRGLENGIYGRDYLNLLDDRLNIKYVK